MKKAEGASTAPLLVAAAMRHGLDLPVASAVADLVTGVSTVDDVVVRLLARPLRAET